MSEVELLQAAIASGGAWYAVAMAAVVAGIRIYRHPVVQGLLPVVAQWSRLKPWARIAIIFAASGLSAWVTGVMAGQSVVASLSAALITALGAIGGHKATKAVGHAQTAAAMKKDGSYAPGAVRSAMAVVLPVDHKGIKYNASIRTSVDRNLAK